MSERGRDCKRAGEGGVRKGGREKVEGWEREVERAGEWGEMQLREKVGVGSGVERKRWEGESKQERNMEQECGIEHKEQKIENWRV